MADSTMTKAPGDSSPSWLYSPRDAHAASRVRLLRRGNGTAAVVSEAWVTTHPCHASQELNGAYGYLVLARGPTEGGDAPVTDEAHDS